MPADRLVVIGRAVKVFGIKGELKVRPYSVSLEPFTRSPELVLDDTTYRVRAIRPHKNAVLLSVEGIDTPEKARELVGALVKTDAANLPPTEEDEYYWFELIGSDVVTTNGRNLGRVVRIIETGANDVLQVEGPLGEILLPMIDDVVIDVDTEKGEIVVDPLEGLIPDG